MRSILSKTRMLCQAELCLLTLLALAAQAVAQTPPVTSSPAPTPSPTPSLEKRFLGNILRDQRAIWTSPLNLKSEDAKWLVPLGLTTAALIATDRSSTSELVEHGDNQTRLSISHDISQLGAFYTTGGIAAAFYLAGRAGNNEHARETGLLGAEALIDAGIVSTVLKAATQRPRPQFDQGRGDFRDDGNSFPSGHATSAWALATVVAKEYRHRRWVVFSAYGLAAAVSVSRYTGRNHFLSDVLVGSTIGYGIGGYVYHQHHDPRLDTRVGHPQHRITQSKIIPFITPRYSSSPCADGRTYGLTLAWHL